jgi:glycosyltransferase involved in cell wall biosynthesis
MYGRLAAILTGVPRIVSAMRNTVDDMPWHYRLVSRILGHWTDRVTVNAHAIRDGVRKALGVPEEKLTTIYNGINPRSFDTASLRGNYRGMLGIPDGVKVIAMIGRMAPQKDHFTLIRAAGEIVKEKPRVRFLLVGDGPLRPRIEKAIQTAGLADYFVLTGNRRDVWEITNEIDILVLSTHFEGCSNVIMEAMTAGKPVVATNAGGNAELVADGETGRIVPVKDAPALASALKELLGDEALAREMGRRGRVRMEQVFSIQNTVEQTVQLYDELRGLAVDHDAGVMSADE